ncbi:hypothetical protein ACVW0K_006891 [Streptomyces filamentosus]
MDTCRTATTAVPFRPVLPAPPGLTRRRHIDLARVSGTGCPCS